MTIQVIKVSVIYYIININDYDNTKNTYIK